MSQNIGTLVSAAIRPNDSFDPIATAYGNEIKGGLHSYETLGEVYSIITARREWGMLASVYNDGDNNGTYKLKYGYFNTDITENSNWIKTSVDSNTTTEWVDSVISILLVEPILEPFLGDRYLLGTTSSAVPTGTQWDGLDGATIVEYNINGFWDVTIPTNGMTVRDDSNNNVIYKYHGTFPDGEWKLERITNVFYIEPSSANGITYSTTTSPQFTSYTNDLIFLTKFFTPNIGSASLNINGLGYKQIKIATTGGLRDLILSDIDTTSIYSLSYNGTYFQLTKPFPSDAHNIEFYISPGETMLVQDYEQYWVYGDLTVAGTLVNYGKVVIANGSLILEGTGILDNQGDGEVILVDLFNTPIFNNTSTIELSSEITTNGPSFSAAIIDNSITTNLLNTVGGVTASYLLSNDGSGSFQWVSPPVIGSVSTGTSSNSNLVFYNLGGTTSATNSTTNIYRTGSLNIGSGTVSNGRFVVSSLTGTVSLTIDDNGNVYNGNINNTKFGYQALYLNTTGIYNTSLGYQSLLNNIDGHTNVAIGHQALYSNTSGNSNVAIGAWSLYFSVNDTYNTAIGKNSATLLKLGQSNVAIGFGAAVGVTASGNVVVGSNAGAQLSTGSNNTFVGNGSGNQVTTGSYNIILGLNSSSSALTTGSYNVVIGRPTTIGATTSNSVFIADNQGNTRVKFNSVGTMNITSVLEYSDNTAALSAGLVIGDVYRTVDILKVVH